MRLALFTMLVGLFLGACSLFHSASGGASAEAKITPLGGSQIAGSVTFTQKKDRVQVHATLTGLTGVHGFHIHEKGDCSAPDGASAGPHFNPGKAEHGGRSGAPRHGGDLGNLESQSGNVDVKFEVEGLTVGTGAPDDIANRAVIVHAGPDDLKSQPAGNSGKRVGCGVIALK